MENYLPHKVRDRTNTYLLRSPDFCSRVKIPVVYRTYVGEDLA